MISEQQVLARLQKVRSPDRQSDIVSAGLVRDLRIDNNNVSLAVAVPADQLAALQPLQQAAEQVLAALPDIGAIKVQLLAQSSQPDRQTALRPVTGVGAIIAVASGKGGVGKSTTAVNLALGLQARGLQVGLMDADIYGPSLPRLLRVTGRPQATPGRILTPLTGYGLKMMSMGLLVEEDTPMIWRGPMVIQAMTQMLRDVAWAPLDVLVVDMPPGTGDAQLTLAQNVPLAGAVIVSTPQDLALADARKGINMFRRVAVPILGLIENMSVFLCPHCGQAAHIFGDAGVAREADALGVPLLGAIPLDGAIRAASDAGTPPMIQDPDSAYGRLYRDIAEKTWARIQAEQALQAGSGPAIVME